MDAPDDVRRFVWHPDYQGQTNAEARAELLREIESDQRAYALALEGADQHENDALGTVIALERKWGMLSLDWPEVDPAALADAMLAAEWERERRQEMVPLADLSEHAHVTATPPPEDAPEAMRLTNSTARLVVLVVVALALALFLWRAFG
ncbi:MAG: hypothetical protein IT337_11605 [Thermomicrobiales bacterium]|nr:hypothetical protein [Thermomicrobiales bacterium]